MTCPHCGAPEVEIWCYQAAVQCYNCGAWIENQAQADCGNEAELPATTGGRWRVACQCGGELRKSLEIRTR